MFCFGLLCQVYNAYIYLVYLLVLRIYIRLRVAINELLRPYDFLKFHFFIFHLFNSFSCIINLH